MSSGCYDSVNDRCFFLKCAGNTHSRPRAAPLIHSSAVIHSPLRKTVDLGGSDGIELEDALSLLLLRVASDVVNEMSVGFH